MKVNNPEETLERLQQLLDEYWVDLTSDPKPDNERDWSHLHGRQEAMVAVYKMLGQIRRENGYFVEEELK